MDRALWSAVLTAAIVCACGRPRTADITEFVGSWRVDYEPTVASMERESGAPPKGVAANPALLKTLMALLEIRIAPTELVVVRGAAETALPFTVKAAAPDSVTLLCSGAEGRTLELTLLRTGPGQVRLRSSTTNDLDRYVWTRGAGR